MSPPGTIDLNQMVGQIGRAGANPFLVKQALTEMQRRRGSALARSGKGLGRLLFGDSLPLGFPHAVEVDDDVFLALDLATRADLVASVSTVSRRYLARKEPRHYLLNVLYAAATFLPQLDRGQTVGELREATP